MTQNNNLESTNAQYIQVAVMSSSLFRFFIRKNYAELEIENEEIDAIGIAFSEYLKNKLNEEQLKIIIPKSEIDVIMNTENLTLQFGFHPALVLHFMEFVKVSSDALGC